MTSIRRTSTVVAGLFVALGLSGCAVTGTNFQPGVAVQVGEQTISTDEVNTLTTDFCAAIQDSGEAQGQQFPLGALRSQVAQSLLVQAAAEELARAEGIEPGADYTAAISQLESDVAALTADQQEAVLRVQGGQSFVNSVLTETGEEPLLEVLRTQVDVNPVYDITISEEGIPEIGSAEVSTGVGEVAVLAGLEELDPAYVASLPASQRCG